jgi:sigma-E factor negative regulatory protein RseC
MKEVGKIVEIKGRVAKVEMERTSACGKCRACSRGEEDTNKMYIDAHNGIGAKEGDVVGVDLETKKVLKAAMIIYFIPLLALIFGVVGGTYISGLLGFENSETIGAVTGAVLVAVSYIIIKMLEPKFRSEDDYNPIITEIIEK